METGPWFNHVCWLYQLQRGGYPFAADELTLDEWLALGELRDLIEAPTDPEDLHGE